MSIYEHDIDTDQRNPANAEILDIVKCYCHTCDVPQCYEDEKKFCDECGDLIIYVENDGREFDFDGSYYNERS